MNFLKLVLNNFLNFLFARNVFKILFGKIKILVKPRSLDMFVVAETYLDKVYEEKFTFKINPKYIVDFGAHIGDSSIWFANRYNPNKILAVEMDKGSYNLLLKNITLNNLSKKITALNKAVYYMDGKYVAYRKTSIFSIANFVTRRFGNQRVETISLKTIIDMIKTRRIDYLKIDIEGSEKFLFNSKNKKLFKNNVAYIAVECHSVIGLSADKVKSYLENLGYDVIYKKTTLLNSHNRLLHAYNRAILSSS